MTGEHDCWKSGPWMYQDLWYDSTYGPDLWRMLTSQVTVVTAGSYSPALPCFEKGGCEDSCDFCCLQTDGLSDQHMPVIIDTVPVFHGMLTGVPWKSRSGDPHVNVQPCDPFETEHYHCGLFVAVEQHVLEPHEGEYGFTSVSQDLEVSDICLDGALCGVLPYWAVPLEDLPDWLQSEVHHDNQQAEAITEKAIDEGSVDLLMDGFAKLEATRAMWDFYQERRYQWRSLFQEIGDECSLLQSR